MSLHWRTLPELVGYSDFNYGAEAQRRPGF